MNKKIILSFIFLLSLCFSVSSQNIKNVDVNNLSEEQIGQIAQEVQKRGLTINQAVIIARSRGASEQQIYQLKMRFREMQSLTPNSQLSNNGQDSLNLYSKQYDYSQKENLEATERNKKVFGFTLFNNKNLTFEPSINIATPKNYNVGIGDELLINVWGAGQQTYQLSVSTDGAIYIQDLGPVYISGMDFKEAKKLIIKRLSSIYSGLKEDIPNTWASVSLTRLHAITINVIGEVNLPGTYQIPSTATAFNALYLSGGPNENGSFRKIRLIRDGKVKKIIDVYDFLINAKVENNVQLRDGDILFIPTYDLRVEVDGAFKRNGFFELVESDYFSNLLKYTGGFADTAYQKRVSIIRMNSYEKEFLDVEQSKFDQFKLSNGDFISAGAVIDRFKNRVIISGAVFRPGAYQLTNGLSLSELIAKAEGIKEDVFSNRGLIIRQSEDLSTKTISFDLNDVLSKKKDILLQREDSVQINTIFDMREERLVNIIGEVQNEGEYIFHKDMTIQDLIFMAGGFNESASELYVEVSRRHNYKEASVESAEMVNVFNINIDRALGINPSQQGFILSPFDYVYVRRAPSYFKQQTIKIEGEIMYPGSYSIQAKNERISELIKRSGGITKFANIDGATLKRVVKVQDINLDEINEFSDTTFVASSIREAQTNLVELHLEEIINQPGSVYDYFLRSGDIINIPTATQEIRVNGEVMNPIGLAYEKGKTLSYYIDKAGGFTVNAKKSKVYVLYANGTTKITKRFMFIRNSPRIEPGCQIIAPSRPDRIRTNNSGTWMAFASIISSLAIAFATIFK